MDNIFVKQANKNILEELKSIEFDSSYINVAQNKYIGETYKIFNLKPYEANILKQLCLSLGFDCAVSRNTIMCNCEYTNAIIFCSKSQLNKLIEKLKKQPFRLKNLANKFLQINFEELKPITINNICFNWSKPYIMGILNITPDSFSDGGKYINTQVALEYAKKMISEGADIIDIGGESTRPNAKTISIDEEISRVIPIIKAIREYNTKVPISIDTRNYETAQKAIECGANIINDVSGLDYDKKLFDYVSQNNIPTIIMHSNKIPAESKDFTNNDIIEEIYISLEEKIDELEKNNIEKSNIIIDVGFGFGKSTESNFELIKRIEEFKTLNKPILAGISRKSFIKNSFEDIETATAFYTSILAQKKVNIHRVHNVKLTKKFLRFIEKIN